jgi:redox-sensing transcriptional repressor
MIASELHLDPTQVRKDLAFTGIVGRPRVGYEVASLITAIEDFLGWSSLANAVLVGAGSLGTALLGYSDFREHGLMLVAAFDTHEAKVGLSIHGREVKSISELSGFLERHSIEVGVLTLPADAAQGVAELLVQSGVRGIWNFTPADLELPEEIVVENVRLSSSLAVLSARLADLREGVAG